jgi:hypothetical protein
VNEEAAIATPVGQLFYGRPLTMDKRHVYKWNGIVVPGVTSICRVVDKPALKFWAANAAVDYIRDVVAADQPVKDETLEAARKAHVNIKDEGAAAGKEVHSYAQACFGQNALLPITSTDPGVVAACTAFRDWWGRHTIHPIAVERPCFSANHLYAGTMDFFGRIDGELGVMDIKTSKGVYPDFWLQLTGYELAIVEELKLVQPLARWVLHLSKETGQFRLHGLAMNREHLATWITLVVFHRYWTKMEKELEKAFKEVA